MTMVSESRNTMYVKVIMKSGLGTKENQHRKKGVKIILTLNLQIQEGSHKIYRLIKNRWTNPSVGISNKSNLRFVCD
jgi:hypothetical protein